MFSIPISFSPRNVRDNPYILLLRVNDAVLSKISFITHFKTTLGEVVGSWLGQPEPFVYDRIDRLNRYIVPAFFLMSFSILAATVNATGGGEALSCLVCISFPAFYDFFDSYLAIDGDRKGRIRARGERLHDQKPLVRGPRRTDIVVGQSSPSEPALLLCVFLPACIPCLTT